MKSIAILISVALGSMRKYESQSAGGCDEISCDWEPGIMIASREAWRSRSWTSAPFYPQYPHRVRIDHKPRTKHNVCVMSMVNVDKDRGQGLMAKLGLQSGSTVIPYACS